MGAGQYGDGLGQFTVGGQSAMQVGVDAKNVGQGDGVGLIGLRPRHRVPFAVAGGRQRVDRIHGSTGCP